MRDIVYGARPPARNSGFAVIAVFTLAPGIGANTSIFSFVKAWVLRLLLYPNSARVLALSERDIKKGWHSPVAAADSPVTYPGAAGSAYRSYVGLAIRATQRGAGIRARRSRLRVFSMEI